MRHASASSCILCRAALCSQPTSHGTGTRQGGRESSHAQCDVSSIRKAAERGDAAAQYNLGAAYTKGYGVPQDYAQAVYWTRKAAEHGNADAQYNLGVDYHNGQGVPQDYAEAYIWYDLAAAGKLKAAKT